MRATAAAMARVLEELSGVWIDFGGRVPSLRDSQPCVLAPSANALG